MSTGATPKGSEAAIWSAHAHIRDKRAMAALVAPLPRRIKARARTVAKTPNNFCMCYDAPTRKAFLLQLGSNGILSCVTFEKVSDAETTRRLAEAIAATEPPVYFHLLGEIYSRVTGLKAIPLDGQPPRPS